MTKEKELIEKLKKEFEENPITHTWSIQYHEDGETYPEWYLLEFGKYCYDKAKKELKK